uniref:Zinc-hook domain-containing protein n=1 Tax=Ananas comosus var. bracteatus TaxID=296719 RepID=A0A6V7Q079_ANACO|nr:unnamed protein product [Ananas comosus var. bracteatus]
MKDEETKSSLLSQTINDSMREIGKLQAEADAHNVVRHERDSTIQKIFTKHNLGSLPDAPFSNDVAVNLTNRLKMRLLDLEKDLQDKKKAGEMELKFLWERYVAVNARCSEIEGQRQAKIESKFGISKRIKEKENERDFAEQELSNLNLAHIDDRERNLQIEVERKTLVLGERDYESTINQKRTEIFSIEQKIRALYREKDVLASDSEDRVKLDLKKEELESCKRKLKKMHVLYKIRGVLKGRLPSEKDLKKEIANTFGRERGKIGADENTDTKAHLSKLQKDMDAKRRFLDSKLQSLIAASLDIDSFPKFLLDAMEKRDVQKSKYNIADGMRQMFDPFERVARAHHICPCCERPFSPNEEDEFVQKQRVKSASSAEHMKLLAVECSNADTTFQQLDKLRMIYEEYVKLGKETMPLAEKTLNELMEELNQKTQAFDDLVGVLAHVKADKDAVEALVQPAEALNALQSKRDTLNTEVENLREEQRFLNDDLSNIQMRWHALREEKLKASSILHKVKKAEEDLVLLAEDKTQADLDEKHLEDALGPLVKEKEKLLQEHTSLKSKLEKEYDEQAERKRSFQQEIETLLTLNARIKDRKAQGFSRKHTLSESQLQKCENRKQEISADLNKSKELLRNQDQLKRNIDDNLNYRKTKAEVDQLTHEIESLEEKVLSIGSMSTLEADLKRHLQEKERLLSELNRCHGTLSVYQSNISKHKLDLKQSQYNDIDKRYFNQLIQLKTTEMANKDLDRYYSALDKALMRFHTMKMEEINKIIKELWQQTYRGQDIDYISIHSDSEGAGTRSYSYRVLMQTGDAELEMRGRCSAGQKVLASLIIRLALAETFCLNCGILALDEPTTNLDGPNAESLAAALLRIMEDRKGQENFQLIVITHDERFAQLIGQRQHAEKYYRVTKDEHQHSIIEVQDIFD